MPVPPPFRDPTHIETRLLVVAAMLEKAVAEVHRAMEDIRCTSGGSAPNSEPNAVNLEQHGER